MEPYPAAKSAKPVTLTILHRLDIPERMIDLTLEHGTNRVPVSVSSRSAVCQLQELVAESHAALGLPERPDWINLELVLIPKKSPKKPQKFWGADSLVQQYGGWLGNFPGIQGSTVQLCSDASTVNRSKYGNTPQLQLHARQLVL